MLLLLLYQLYVLSSLVLMVVLLKVVRAYRLRDRQRLPRVSLEKAPTVSVCIPVRNETAAMTACLESVLASQYPKLEIIVLDDNSTDNTSQLIRAFAHAGVRFIPGQAVPSGWLGKNYALSQLADEASGRLIVFMDVDTRVRPHTIDQLVARLLRDELAMLSVLPQRPEVGGWGVWLGSLRYLWDVLLHSQRRPSASSALWMVYRQTLSEAGGIARWRDSMQPERALATECQTAQGYRLWMSTPELGVTVQKTWSSQLRASQRLLLPRFDGSMAALLVNAGLLAAALLPQIVLVVALAYGWQPALWGILLVGLVATLAFTLYCRLLWPTGWWLAPLLAPVVAWQELLLIIGSAMGYARGTIAWKGRPIQRPVTKKKRLNHG